MNFGKGFSLTTNVQLRRKLSYYKIRGSSPARSIFAKGCKTLLASAARVATVSVRAGTGAARAAASRAAIGVDPCACTVVKNSPPPPPPTTCTESLSSSSSSSAGAALAAVAATGVLLEVAAGLLFSVPRTPTNCALPSSLSPASSSRSWEMDPLRGLGSRGRRPLGALRVPLVRGGPATTPLPLIPLPSAAARPSLPLLLLLLLTLVFVGLWLLRSPLLPRTSSSLRERGAEDDEGRPVLLPRSFGLDINSPAGLATATAALEPASAAPVMAVVGIERGRSTLPPRCRPRYALFPF